MDNKIIYEIYEGNSLSVYSEEVFLENVIDMEKISVLYNFNYAIFEKNLNINNTKDNMLNNLHNYRVDLKEYILSKHRIIMSSNEMPEDLIYSSYSPYAYKVYDNIYEYEENKEEILLISKRNFVNCTYVIQTNIQSTADFGTLNRDIR